MPILCVYALSSQELSCFLDAYTRKRIPCGRAVYQISTISTCSMNEDPISRRLEEDQTNLFKVFLVLLFFIYPSTLTFNCCVEFTERKRLKNQWDKKKKKEMFYLAQNQFYVIINNFIRPSYDLVIHEQSFRVRRNHLLA